jgi:hypothetical protein
MLFYRHETRRGENTNRGVLLYWNNCLGGKEQLMAADFFGHEWH